MNNIEFTYISIELLLLDPNNPRLIQQMDDMKEIPDNEIEKCQDRLLKKFDILGKKNEEEGFFNTDDLAGSMRTFGWLPGNGLVVRKIKDSKYYVVVEGNRRISTVKHLLKADKDSEGETLSPTIKKRLEKAEVQIIPDGPDQKKQIDDILETRHGSQRQLPWGPYETALYFLDTYLEQVIDGEGPLTKEQFKFSPKRANATAKLYCTTPKRMKDALMTAIVYRQIEVENANEKIKPNDYSLLKTCLTNGNMKSDYLTLDETNFKLDDKSYQRIDTICQFGNRDNEKKILQDDKAVARFGHLVKATNNSDETLADYAKNLLGEVEQEVTSLDNANAFYKDREASRKFLERLKKHLTKREERGQEGGSLSYDKFNYEGDDLQALDELKETPIMEWLELFKK